MLTIPSHGCFFNIVLPTLVINYISHLHMAYTPAIHMADSPLTTCPTRCHWDIPLVGLEICTKVRLPHLSIPVDQNISELWKSKILPTYIFYMACFDGKLNEMESWLLDRNLCCSLTSRTVHPTSRLKGWQMDSPATHQPTTFRLAKPREHFEGAPPIPLPSADELSKPGQIRVPSNKELHTQPGSRVSASLHRLHKQNPFAKHDLGFGVGK